MQPQAKAYKYVLGVVNCHRYRWKVGQTLIGLRRLLYDKKTSPISNGIEFNTFSQSKNLHYLKYNGIPTNKE